MHRKHFLRFGLSLTRHTTQLIFILFASKSDLDCRAETLLTVSVCVHAYAVMMLLIEPLLKSFNWERMALSMSSSTVILSRSRIFTVT